MADLRGPATPHADHDLLLIAAWASGDAGGTDRERAERLVAQCAGCRELGSELRAIRSATSALPSPSRPRDFRLTREDADRLRSRRGWTGATIGRLLGGGSGGFGGTGGFARPLAASLTALGLAGLLFSALPLGAPAAAPVEQSRRMQAPGGAVSAPASPAATVGPWAAPAGAAGGAGGEAAASSAPEIAAEATDTTRQDAAEPDMYEATGGTDTSVSVAPVAQATASPEGAGATDDAASSTALSSGSDGVRPVIAAGSVALLAAGVVLLYVTRSRGRPAG